MTHISQFDFVLPPELIAQEPHERGSSRLLVVDRAAGSWSEKRITDLPALLSPGDRVVANDTRVFPARLLGHRDPSGGAAECLLLERNGPDEWQALVHPGQKLKPGARVVFEDADRGPGVRLVATILKRRFCGRRVISLEAIGAPTVEAAIDAIGHVPLPPYIHRPDRADDREAYQTVYARARGSVAAPTAGLHLDAALIRALEAAGIGWSTVTLHVGYGTFKPVRVEDVAAHQVDAEHYAVAPQVAQAVGQTRASGGRIVAVGTTTTRALESAADERGRVAAGEGRAELFIYPGYRFRAVDALLTNFHLPRSSLLLLVAAFAGTDLTMRAYRDAVARGFRFYSYGDAMLVL